MFHSFELAQVALTFRSAILLNKRVSVMKKYHEFYENNADKSIAFGPVGTRLGFLSIISSWCSFPYYELEFSSGLEKPIGPTKPSRLGEVMFVHPTALGPLRVQIKPVTVVVKDENGGYWLKANLLKSAWKVLTNTGHNPC